MTSIKARRAGRITVMFAFLMVGMAVFMGLSLNVSQIFQQRAHLQVCADAAAFSGAVQQARGLNRIARMNNEAAKVLKIARIALQCPVFPNHDAGQRAALSAEVSYRIYNGVNLVRQEKVNIDSARDASQTAEQVTARNEPSARLSSFTPSSSCVGRLIPVRGTSEKFGFFFKQATPLGEIILFDPGRSVKSIVLRKALALDTVYYTAQVTRPSFPWAFNWRQRGCGIQNLRAYATAKPAGGRLWEGSAADPQYKTKMVRTGSVFPRPAIPDSWGYDW
ncbi:MAG: Tad domain-containing protein [Kiritimatiellia bacterium]